MIFSKEGDFLYKESAGMFKAPEVIPSDKLELKWKEPDEAGFYI